MKLSKETVSLIKNFAGINSNLAFEAWKQTSYYQRTEECDG
jgi:hypothetical protein